MTLKNYLNSPAPISGAHYSIIRFSLGLYLFIHFLHLLPYGTEIFTAEGVFPKTLSPLMGIIPNPLNAWDNTMTVTLLLLSGASLSLCLAIGWAERTAAIGSTLILGWLFARNPLIANPSLPVVGWLLVMTLFIPKGAYGALCSRNDANTWARWQFPNGIWIAAWIMLAVAYSYSGYTKLLSPSWVDGSAVSIVLNNPLARDHFLREWILSLPELCLQLVTWGILWIEVLFLPLAIFSRARAWIWSIMLLAQLGFLSFLSFADLTFPMLLIHALTFDPRWLRQRSIENTTTVYPILFFDGYCAFCNNIVRFILAEDQHKKIKVAPLHLLETILTTQSQSHTTVALQKRPDNDDTIIFVDKTGKAHVKSAAVVHILKTMGGIWPLAGCLLEKIPSSACDTLYDQIGRLRYRLAGRLKDACALLPNQYRERLLSHSPERNPD